MSPIAQDHLGHPPNSQPTAAPNYNDAEKGLDMHRPLPQEDNPATPSPTTYATSHVNDTRVDSESNRDSLGSFSSGPPPLNYTLRTKRRTRFIALFFTLLFIDSGILPLILFYSLRWGAHLSSTKNLAIITSTVGTTAGLKIAQRTYLLWFHHGCESKRPMATRRWGVDAFHILISLALTFYLIPLIIGSSLNPGSPRTVAMALPCVMLTFSIPLLLSGAFDRRIHAPFPVSSLPHDAPLPPLTYTIVEDVIAVDGGGGLAFRHAWARRYQASGTMRRLLRVAALGWGASGTAIGVILVVAAWTAPTDTAYGLGFGIPWLWGIVSALATIWYVRRMLTFEARNWGVAGEGAAHRQKRLGVEFKGDADDRAVEQKQKDDNRVRPEVTTGPQAGTNIS